MKYKAGLQFIILVTLLIISLIFSIIGSYQLYVELNNELGFFYISLSIVPVFIVIGIIIGFIIKGE